jgi:transcription elongation factor Elf1
MGYYTCPRCGSHETYEARVPSLSYHGTELGIKCKKCSETLEWSEHYTFSPEDEKQFAEENRKSIAKTFFWLILVIFAFFSCMAYVRS